MSDDRLTTLEGEMDTEWLMQSAALVFLMQAGFAMLEVGSVNAKNTRNILLKNVLDGAIGALVWWLLGYGIAQGKSPSGFVGISKFALTVDQFEDPVGNGYASWVFQWAFAATTATIVSGAVAERCTITAYLVYSVLLIGLVYPVVVQVGWGGDGAMSPWLRSEDKKDYFMGCGVLDFAGCGVVHMTGGVAAIVGATFLGPRKSFVEGTITTPIYGPVFQTLGTLILWFGWYGFNAGSTLAIVGYGNLAAKVMATTTISAASGAITTLAYGSYLDSKEAGHAMILLEYANNGVLAGLVGITAACATVEPYGACFIGIGAGFVYVLSSKFLVKLGIDDVVDACPVHGFCGAYGLISAALWTTPHNYKAAYGIYDGSENTCQGLFYGGGAQLGASLVFLLFVVAWAGGWACLIFGTLNHFNLLRIPEYMEVEGMDSTEHGAPKMGDLGKPMSPDVKKPKSPTVVVAFSKKKSIHPEEKPLQEEMPVMEDIENSAV